MVKSGHARRRPLALLWPSVGAQFEQAAMRAVVPAQGTSAASTPAAAKEWQLPSGWTAPALPSAVAAQRLQLSLRDEEGEPEYLWVSMAARAVGTIVHAELQRLAQLETLPSAPDLRVGDYLPWLAELGVEPAEREASAQRILSALTVTLADERGPLAARCPARGGIQRISPQRKAGRPRRQCHRRSPAGATRWRPLDRRLQDQQPPGRWAWAFLAQQEERYRSQLRRYVQLARALSPGEVRAALYFPLLGEFREVDVDR